MEFAKKKGNILRPVAGGVKKEISEKGKKGKKRHVDDSNLPPEERERRRIQRELRVRMAPCPCPMGHGTWHAGELLSC